MNLPGARRWRSLAALALAALLTACAAPDRMAPGSQRSEVLARLGPPQSRTPLPAGGERLLYSRQPAGAQVFHMDFDAQGRLTQTQQVLTFAQLSAIPMDQWTAADVQRHFGRPMRLERVARFDGPIWTYRFLDDLHIWRQAHIHIDPSGVVRRILFTDEPTPGDDARL